MIENESDTQQVVETETFAYSELAPDVELDIKIATARIKLTMKRALGDLVSIGDELIQVKLKIPHGMFTRWLKSEFDMSKRTAEHFMNVAETFRDRTEAFADLKASVLYQLAAPSTPEVVREAVAERLEAGEVVNDQVVRQLKEELTDSERRLEAERAEKEKAQAEAQSLVDDLEVHDKRVRELEVEQEELKRKIQELEAQEPDTVEVTREVWPDEYAIEEARNQLADLEREKQQLDEEIAEARTSAKALRAQLSEQEDQLARLKDFKQRLLGLLAEYPKVRLTGMLANDNASVLTELKAIAGTMEEFAGALCRAGKQANKGKPKNNAD